MYRPNDPLNLWEATLTPHYFRHNFVTMLYRAGVDLLKAMKIVGHNEYQTTADIFTHLDQEDDAGNGGGPGRRIQEGRYGGPEEADAEASQQGALVPQDGQLSLISRSFGSGLFVVWGKKTDCCFCSAEVSYGRPVLNRSCKNIL